MTRMEWTLANCNTWDKNALYTCLSNMHVCHATEILKQAQHMTKLTQCLNSLVAMLVYYKKILKLQNWPHLFIFNDVYLQSIKKKKEQCMTVKNFFLDLSCLENTPSSDINFD